VEAPEQLRITWAGGQEFLSAYDRVAGHYTISVPHSSPVLRHTSVGAQLLVEHQFVDTERSFRHVARIVDHRAGPPEIVTLEFVDDRSAQLVVCHAEGQSVPYLNRRVERRPVWMPIEYGERPQHGIVTELSELGAFIATKAAPPDGTIRLRLPANGVHVGITAKVLYARELHEPGFAVEFAFADRDEELEIQDALRRALQANQRR